MTTEATYCLVFLLCKVIHGGWTPIPLEAEIIPPGQDDICQCGQVNEDEDSSFGFISRVVGGSKTPPNRFPWLAGLFKERNEEWTHTCGGSLISSQHVLTAAHCVEKVGPDKIRVLLGGHSRKYQSQNLRTVSNITRHEKYNHDYIFKVITSLTREVVLAKKYWILENDFAILTLENKVGYF